MNIKNILTALIHAVCICNSKLYINPFHLFRHKTHAEYHSLSAGEALFPPHFTFKLDPPEGNSCKVHLAGLRQRLSVSPNKENDKKWKRNYYSTVTLEGKICKGKQLELRREGLTRGISVINISACVIMLMTLLGHFPAIKKTEPGT